MVGDLLSGRVHSGTDRHKEMEIGCWVVFVTWHGMAMVVDDDD